MDLAAQKKIAALRILAAQIDTANAVPCAFTALSWDEKMPGKWDVGMTVYPSQWPSHINSEQLRKAMSDATGREFVIELLPAGSRITSGCIFPDTEALIYLRELAGYGFPVRDNSVTASVNFTAALAAEESAAVKPGAVNPANFERPDGLSREVRPPGGRE